MVSLLPFKLCSIECIFNQTNILANGRFDRNVAFNVYADFYPEIPIDLLTRTIDRCTKQLRNYLISRRRRRNQIGRSLPLRRCRNGSGLFAACFNREIYRNCPIDLDSDSECAYILWKLSKLNYFLLNLLNLLLNPLTRIFICFSFCFSFVGIQQVKNVTLCALSLIIVHRFVEFEIILATIMLTLMKMAISFQTIKSFIFCI